MAGVVFAIVDDPFVSLPKALEPSRGHRNSGRSLHTLRSKFEVIVGGAVTGTIAKGPPSRREPDRHRHANRFIKAFQFSHNHGATRPWTRERET